VRRFRTAGATDNSPRPLVGIVVVDYNGLDDTLRCLSTLRDTSYPNLIVFVVDNASENDNASGVAAAFPDVVVSRNEVNLGFAAGANGAMRRALDAGAEYVLFLNNDALLDVDALDRLVDAMERNERIGVAGPRVRSLNEPGRIQNLGYAYNEWFGIPQAVGAGKPVDWAPAKPRQLAWIMGCALLARRTLLMATGGFDPDFFLYSEDHYLCKSARNLGYELCLVEGADVLHRKTTGSEYSRRHIYHVFVSHLIFIAKTAKWYQIPTLAIGTAMLATALAFIALVRRGTFVVPAILQSLFDFCLGKPKRNMSFSTGRTEECVLMSAALAAVVCVVLWPVLRLHWPPMYRHDWHWPLMRDAFASVPSFATSAWAPQNIGGPNLPYTTNLMMLLAQSALGTLLGVKASLDVLLVVLGLAAAFGAARLCSALLGRWDWVAMAVAGAAYVAAPVFSDQLVAGHIDDLAGVAAFPWFVLGLVSYQRAPRARTLAGTALAAGLCAIQVQYLVLLLVPVAWSIVAFHNRRALVVGCAAICFMLAVNAPTLYQIGRTHAGAAALQNDRAVVSEEVRQSADILPALIGSGYFAGYDGAADGSNGLTRILNLLALAALPALAATLRYRAIGLLLAGIYATGFLTIAGLKGPAAPLWSWLFVNVTATSLMRELFHAAPLVALPLSLIAGLVGSRKHLIVVALALLVVLDHWSLSGGAGRWLTAARPVPSDVRAFIQTITNWPGADRIAITPGHQPVYDRATGSVGVDALEYYPLGKHWTYFEYFPTAGINALAADLLLRGDGERTRSILERMSVQAILSLPATEAAVGHDLTPLSGAQDGPALIMLHPRSLVYGAAPPVLAGGDLSRLFMTRGNGDVLALMRQQPAFVEAGVPYRIEPAGQDDTMLAEGCARFVEIPPSRISDSPADAWVLARRFGYAAPVFDYPTSNAILTLASTPASLPGVPHGSRILAAVVSADDAAYRWTGNVPERLPLGQAVVVAGYLDRLPGPCRALAPAAVSSGARIDVVAYERSATVAVQGTLRVIGGAGTLVFTDAYDPGWKLVLDGATVPNSRHFTADGFANGWILTGSDDPRRFALSYEPGSSFNVLTEVSIVLWATVFLAWAFSYGRRRTVVVAEESRS
jgi:GT2 family glycosyltransferase